MTVLTIPTLCFASCIKADGLQFEAIDFDKFLVSREGINIATLSLYRWPNAKVAKNFRFFTEEICDEGAENQILINGQYVRIEKIQLFKN